MTKQIKLLSNRAKKHAGEKPAAVSRVFITLGLGATMLVMGFFRLAAL